MQEKIKENNYMINDLANKKADLFPGNAIDYNQSGNQFSFYSDNDVVLMLQLVSDKIIRFRFANDGNFSPDFSYAIDANYQPAAPQIAFKEKLDHYRITTDRLICTISKEGLRVRIADKSGNILNEDEKGYHWEYDLHTGNDIVKISKKVQSGEFYYGLGDKTCNLNLRGKQLQNWGSDTYGYGKNSDPLYKNIPFYIGLHQKTAYGIFFDNSFRSFFDFASERSNITSFWAQGGEMNYYFIYGPELTEVVEQYTCLTGLPELPPLWALGYHQCKWSYYPEDKFKAIGKEFRDRQIPCDALYLDIDYMEGFRCFTWNKDYFPDPTRMVQELAADGFKTIVIIDPGIKIDKNYWVYKEGLEKDYFCRRADGPYLKGSVWPGLCHFPDYTRPEVREWWADLFKGLIADNGVKGIWNDMNEPAVFEEGTFPDDVRFDYDGNPTSHRKSHNIYGMQMARATYQGVKKYIYPERPFVISRSGYSGLQRFSSTWTGDNVASWDHVWLANIQCQRLSISGISFTGSDIGGFIESPTGELYIRWLQLGIFHALFRTHSSGDHGDQEPWSFGEEYTLLAKKFIELRYQLIPYIYTTFWQYATFGTPMLRPLVFLDQWDSETYSRMAEFGLGDNLLICPITQAEVDGRWLYLPKGNWYYFWDDKAETGGKEVWAEAQLNRIPIYIRAGAVIPFYPVQQFIGEKEIQEVTLHIYYIEGSLQSILYEDNGLNYDYKEGKSILKTFRVTGSKNTISISQNTAGSYTPSYYKYKIILHGLPFTIASWEANGHLVSQDEVEINDQNNERAVLVDPDFQYLSFTSVIA
ncbi:glycoside hydrolase family 31 protein [Adhaeribacter aquaticus]|uniref:glycoside hydrolase family 31 protein n=1 Tax=Adhaeribacter aquaticus TaxID=299567 RepID=UPI00041F9043|nr:glycoside hydrolase family 31 protein [Adhaeribacter aquaticus]